MKKKLERFYGNENLSRIARIMRLTVFLILISTIITFSSESYSQITKLTIKKDNVTVKDVLSSIEEQSEFLFIYQQSQIDLNRTVKIIVEDVPVDIVLNQLFAGTDNTYTINDRQIIIGLKEPTIEKLPPTLLEKEVAPDLQLPQTKNPGTIEGKIKDAQTGEVLPYCNVYIAGTAYGCITDKDGFFSIKNIMPGNYKLTASFIGYKETTILIDVLSGQKTTCDFKLPVVSIQGEEVIITGQAFGQAKAINTQINATNIKNVISEQKIRELPDANVAESLSRLPGVSIERQGGEATSIRVRGVSSNTLYVNGMRMSGGLSSISSSMVSGIELSKAFMPDQDADVLGGSVDFKMRDAKSGFNGEIWGKTGYNNFTKSFKMHEISLLLGNRFFNDKLGIMMSLNYDQKNRGKDNVSAKYITEGSGANSEVVKPVKLISADLEHNENLNNRYGLTLYSDYKLTDGKLYYQMFLSNINSDNLISGNRLTTGEEVPTLAYKTEYYENVNRNFLQGLGGEHKFLGAKIEWFTTMSKNSTTTPEDLIYFGANYEGVPNSGNMDTTTTIEDLIIAADHNLANTWATTIQKKFNESYTNELSAKIDIEIPFILGNNVKGFVKFGGKVSDLKRGYEANLSFNTFSQSSTLGLYKEAQERMPEFDWKYAQNGWIGHESFVSEPYTQDFSMYNAQTWYRVDQDKLNYVLGNVEDLLEKSMAGDVSDYTNKENYYAGYIMTGINFGRLVTFTPGVRYEKYEYKTTANYTELSPDNGGYYETQGYQQDTTGGHFNAQFFPMFHLKIKPLEWFDIRFAVTKTATRPSFSLMSPMYFRNGTYDINKGDIYLNPQLNYNYDTYFSFYTKKIGLLTIGAFYKKITDQVLTYSVVIINPEDFGLSPAYSNRNYTYPKNNQWDGFVKGLEFDWQTHFSYLPKPFNGIVLNANFTLLQSETRYPFYSFTTVLLDEYPYIETVGEHSSRKNKIIGMPDRVGNIALGYELGGFSGRISAYYQSATITAAQSNNIALDVDKDELLRMDLQLSQKFKKINGLMVYFNLNNITNNSDRSHLTYYPERKVREEIYGVSGDIGVRYKF